MKTGIYIPAEWERQQDIWTAWPSHDDDDRWPGERLAQARSEVAQMVRALAQGQKVIVLACGAQSVENAQAHIGNVAAVVPALFGDTWLRDTGPVFGYDPAGRLSALRFRHNGWGGKFIYEHDDTVGDFIAEQKDAHIRRFDFILEGGAIEHDGQGTILTTRQCVLNPNRNKNWSENDAEAALRESFGAKRIVWLDDGLLNDHTDGHIDNLARFVAPGLVACPAAFGDDDPNAAVYEKTTQTLIAEGFEIVRIPSPGLVRDDNGLIVPASHMNFVIGNKAVVMPCYGTESEGAAREILQKLFPSRTVSAARSNTLLTGGGSFHCITQQVPVIRSSGKDEI